MRTRPLQLQPNALAAGRTSGLLAAGLLVVLASCWQPQRESTSLSIDRTSPQLGDPDAPVLLNDSLTVYFDGSIQPVSVSQASVALVDEDGHQVPGTLKTGENWVAFRPNPPMRADLGDGSFLPGGRYRLVLAGLPRPDSIRGKDGSWLQSAVSYDVFVADRDQIPGTLPSILRPPATDLPFLLHDAPEGLQKVAADAPVLQLHFSLPVLPSTVRPECFEVRLLNSEELIPRSATVTTSPLDDHPGCTVQLDLGALPQRTSGISRPLQPGTFLGVQVRASSGLTDYAGMVPLPPEKGALYWNVVAGASVPICEWPLEPGSEVVSSGLQPGFEVAGSTIRPRCRVEAGNGSLGVFRPTADLTLRPGEPFDRGDGQLVVSDGPDFPFLAIDIPEGVVVTVDARQQPVRLRSCGGVRIAGEVRLLATPAQLPFGRFGTQPVADLIDVAPVAVVAAGDIELRGRIETDSAIAEGNTGLLLATAGWLRLNGPMPFQTMIVVEARTDGGTSRIEGPRGQSRPYAASFTRGLAPGARFQVVGELPWQQVPLHVDGGVLRIGARAGLMDIEWQAAPADAVRGDRPDLTAGRIARWQSAREGDAIVVGAGAFVRFRLRSAVRGDVELPSVRGLRLTEN